MSLKIKLQPEEFDVLFDHVNSFRPKYRNMHRRTTKQLDGKTHLRYFHIVRVKDDMTLEGAISGKNLEVHYELKRRRKYVALILHEFEGTTKEKERFHRRFVIELLQRVRDEKNAPEKFLGCNYSVGSFYLKRQKPGSKITDSACLEALTERVASQAFLGRLESWNFLLWRRSLKSSS